jgi:hypothetical protein
MLHSPLGSSDPNEDWRSPREKPTDDTEATDDLFTFESEGPSAAGAGDRAPVREREPMRAREPRHQWAPVQPPEPVRQRGGDVMFEVRYAASLPRRRPAASPQRFHVGALALLVLLVLVAAYVAASMLTGGISTTRLADAVRTRLGDIAGPATGETVLDSTPSDADVLIAGIVQGRTPLRLTMRPGTHTIEIRRGASSRVVRVAVVGGQVTTEHVELAPSVEPSKPVAAPVEASNGNTTAADPIVTRPALERRGAAPRARAEGQRTMVVAPAPAPSSASPTPARPARPDTVGEAQLQMSAIYSADDPDVVPAVPIRRDLPRWSGSARVGTAPGEIEIVVGEDGLVESVALPRPIARGYDEQLLNAARAWRFRPAVRDGRPVKYRARFHIAIGPVD